VFGQKKEWWMQRGKGQQGAYSWFLLVESENATVMRCSIGCERWVQLRWDERNTSPSADEFQHLVFDASRAAVLLTPTLFVGGHLNGLSF
jgi:hypothetical protein